jgi:hypothetical protein
MSEAKESAIAKSTGFQDRDDIVPQDNVLYGVLASKKKITKREANYHRQSSPAFLPSSSSGGAKVSHCCEKCKFNLGDEGKCHIVGGTIDNRRGISKFFSPRGTGMLPGDVVWELVKSTNKKLASREGHVIRKGANGFQCKDCKYYLYSHDCLLLKGKFRPEMSCGYIVKIGSGTEV